MVVVAIAVATVVVAIVVGSNGVLTGFRILMGENGEIYGAKEAGTHITKTDDGISPKQMTESKWCRVVEKGDPPFLHCTFALRRPSAHHPSPLTPPTTSA